MPLSRDAFTNTSQWFCKCLNIQAGEMSVPLVLSPWSCKEVILIKNNIMILTKLKGKWIIKGLEFNQLPSQIFHFMCSKFQVTCTCIFWRVFCFLICLVALLQCCLSFSAFTDLLFYCLKQTSVWKSDILIHLLFIIDSHFTISICCFNIHFLFLLF